MTNSHSAAIVQNTTEPGTPSAWMLRFSHLIKPEGNVLDVAAGKGRNARWLAGQGFKVEAVDRDAAALESMQGIANVTLRQYDLENTRWPYNDQQFDAIVVCRYLHRPLLSLLPHGLVLGGVLIYETYMQGHESYGRPRNPDFLLIPNELLTAFETELEVVSFEQGLLEDSPPAMLQRVCAIKSA